MHVALAGEIGFVLCSLDLPVAQAVGFINPTLELVLHSECHLERDRCDSLDQEIADGGVDRSADDGLAHRIGEEASAPDA